MYTVPMDNKLIIALIASALAVAGNIPYLRDMFKGKIQPHPYTWLVWSIVSGVTFFGQVAKGAGYGAIAFGASEIFTIIIFLFSLKYGFKGITRTDTYFLIAALLGIIPWILTNDPTYSVIIMVTIDLIAFIPTLKKAWSTPASESPLLYSSNAIRHTLTLFALSSFNIATTLHSFAMIVTNTMMTVFILRKKLDTQTK